MIIILAKEAETATTDQVLPTASPTLSGPEHFSSAFVLERTHATSDSLCNIFHIHYNINAMTKNIDSIFHEKKTFCRINEKKEYIYIDINYTL